MKYKDIIKLNKSFQYSINLQYDLLNLDKVLGYIPTKQSLEVLKEYLISIVKDNNDKATVLIGPYGKGKSHLLLVLISILYSRDSKIKNSILNKIKTIDIETFKLANLLLNSDKKFLPIIINSNNLDLKQSFLIALNDAIKRENLEEIELKTYFDTVIEIVNLWEKSYPDTLKILSDELEKLNITLKVFMKQIKEYSSDAYKLFLNIYPVISSGIEFNPMINTDIVKIYEEFNNEICLKYGFKGLFIVFDEFSKFIEGSVDRNNSFELKILQDFAELSNRSKENQIHLACITHKSINQYISKIPSNKIDAWRAIEGRFKEIYFTTSSKQNFNLIGNTINILDKIKMNYILEETESVKEHYSKAFYLYSDIYKEEKEYQEEIVRNCFPLNAITTYCLPRISEKVAQNERTLFTFLCKKGNNTLWNFIRNEEEGKLLELDILYNYFEILFKKEIFNRNIRDLWIKTDSLLQKKLDEEEKKIIKAIGIINIVSDFERLKPTRDILNMAFSEFDTDKTIEKLLHKGILIERKNNDILDYMPGVSIDINQCIEDTIKTKLKKINLVEELNKIFPLGYITPKRHNDENLMTRFFENRYIDVKEILEYENLNHLVEDTISDGIILNLVYSSENELEKVNEKFCKENFGNIVFNIPKKEFKKEYEVLKLLAIKYLKNNETFLEQDESIFDYLEIIEEDLLEELYNYMSNNFEIDNSNSNIIINGEKQKVDTQEEFNKLISQICDNVFNKTVKINNEMINKNKITAPILKARTKIIDSLLNDEIEIEGNSPEVTIARATLKNKQLLNGNNGTDDIRLVLDEIRMKILNSEKEKLSFKDIYNYLEGFDYGIRMRRGVIPIYIAYIIKEFEEKIVIYFGKRNSKEIEIDSKIFNAINENPEEYFLKLDLGTKEKEEYFILLDELFGKYSGKRKNKNKYVNLLNNMQEWMKSLDNFTRNHIEKFSLKEKISKENILFRRELLKYDVNSREFIFEKLPKIFNQNDYKNLYKELFKSKLYFDNRNNEIKNQMIEWTKNAFIENYKGSLSGALQKWNRDLDRFRKEYIYNIITNRLLEFLNSLNENNDENIIEELAFILTGLSINDWNDVTYDSYKNELLESLDTIKNLKEETNSNETITFILNGSSNIEKRFSKEEISPLGNTLLNELEEVVDEYGSALTDNEKRTILFNLLEKLI